MPTSVTRWVRWVGIALTIACLGFVLVRIGQLAPRIAATATWSSLLPSVAAATLVYSAGGVLLAIAWWLLLRALTAETVSMREALRGHLCAQIAKYMPGNVFHFAARHVHARQQGLEHTVLASAAVVESVLLVVVASLLSLAIPSAALPESLQWFAAWRGYGVAAVLAALAIISAGPLRRRCPPSYRMGGARLARILGAAVCHLGFFILATIAFRLLLDGPVPGKLALIATVAVCWLGGFLVLGAPGGLGVREALLVALLTPTLGDARAILVALAFRGVTILGDIVLSLLGLLIPVAATGPGPRAQGMRESSE